MWIHDIINALSEMADHYNGGWNCCVDHIKSNVIYMTNGDIWYINTHGNSAVMIKRGKRYEI